MDGGWEVALAAIFVDLGGWGWLRGGDAIDVVGKEGAVPTSRGLVVRRPPGHYECACPRSPSPSPSPTRRY